MITSLATDKQLNLVQNRKAKKLQIKMSLTIDFILSSCMYYFTHIV